MKIRLAIPRRTSLHAACVFLYYMCFVFGHTMVFADMEWVERSFSYAKLEFHALPAAILNFAALAFLLAAIILCIRKIRIPFYILLSVLTMFLCGIVWTARAMDTYSLKSLVFTPATPMFWLCATFVLVGYSEELWVVFKRLLFPFGCLFLFLSLVELIGFHIMVDGIIRAKRIGSSAALSYFLYGFWLIATYATVGDEGILKHGKLLIGITVGMTLGSILFRSRAWIIQALILLVVVLYRSRIRWRNKWLAVVCYILCAALFFLVFWDVILYMFSPMLVRLFDDTRSGQYQQFFTQISWEQLMVGGGIDATYSYSSISRSYKFIDNQFLLEMFRYGILPILVYTILMLRPLVYALIKLDFDMLRRSTVLVLWLMAMGGLSVFFNLNVNLTCTAIFVVCGRLNRMCLMPKEKRG